MIHNFFVRMSFLLLLGHSMGFSEVSETPADQARTLFASFETQSKPLTAEQHKQVADTVYLLLKTIPTHPSGQYLTLLGDGNYYLGDFGRALYYWRCALIRLPNSLGLEQRISLVREMLQLDRPWIERKVSDFVGLTFLPPLMRYVLILSCIGLSLFLWILWQLFRQKSFHYLFFLVGFFSLALLLSVSWYEWVIPPRVIMLKSIELKGSLITGKQKGEPAYIMKTGEEAEVLSTSPDKKWLRIRTVTKQTGYVPGTAVGFEE